MLGETEIEVGLGIHGEQGVQRMPIASADALVKLVIETIEADGKLAVGDRVALLVNGLGTTPPMELAIVARLAVVLLEAKGVVVERAWAGTFLRPSICRVFRCRSCKSTMQRCKGGSLDEATARARKLPR